jgi:hypothetical protein
MLTCTTDYDSGKWHIRPLVREGAELQQNRNYLTVKGISS